MVSEQYRNWFPYRAIEPYEDELVSELCGGRPITRREGVANFFRSSAEPVMIQGRLKFILPPMGTRCAEAMDTNPKAGVKAFLVGAKFYAGVFATLNRLSSIPCKTPVVRELLGDKPGIITRQEVEEEDLEIARTASSRICAEAVSFCDLMDTARPGLGTADDSLHQLAIVGAGVVHVLATGSLEYAPHVESLEGMHPDLAPLEDAFRAIDREFKDQSP